MGELDLANKNRISLRADMRRVKEREGFTGVGGAKEWVCYYLAEKNSELINQNNQNRFDLRSNNYRVILILPSAL